MKTIITGNKNIINYQTLLNGIRFSKMDITEIVSGHQKGIESLAEVYAKETDTPLKIFLADWKKQGQMAGLIKNLQMVEYAEALIVIWDGNSESTKILLDEAKSRGLKTFVHLTF